MLAREFSGGSDGWRGLERYRAHRRHGPELEGFSLGMSHIILNAVAKGARHSVAFQKSEFDYP
jgi:hypothetical protein